MSSVTRKAQSSRMERRAAMERQLLEATERLMADGLAFTELSVDRLATEAGISRATFYVYFEDKGHLLRLLARHVLAELGAASEEWWHSSGGRPEGMLATTRKIVAIYRQHQRLLTAITETAGYDPAVAATYHDLLEGIAANIRTAIDQAQSQGLIRPLNSAETASALTWMVERSCHRMLKTPAPHPDSDDRLATTLAEIIWSSLYLHPLNPSPDGTTPQSDPTSSRR